MVKKICLYILILKFSKAFSNFILDLKLFENRPYIIPHSCAQTGMRHMILNGGVQALVANVIKPKICYKYKFRVKYKSQYKILPLST